MRGRCCLPKRGLGMGDSCNNRVNAYVLQFWRDLIAGSCMLYRDACMKMVDDK